jgi:hypothetical protein
MNRHGHHKGFIPAQTGDLVGGEQLGELPAHCMDGGNEPDQCSRSGQLADKERDDGAKRTESQGGAKENSVGHIHADVVTQVFPDLPLDQRLRHSLILPEGSLTGVRLRARQWISVRKMDGD